MSNLIGDRPPAGLEDRNILIVDFAYSKKEIVKIIKKAKTFVLLDHHQSQMLDLQGNKRLIIEDL